MCGKPRLGQQRPLRRRAGSCADAATRPAANVGGNLGVVIAPEHDVPDGEVEARSPALDRHHLDEPAREVLPVQTQLVVRVKFSGLLLFFKPLGSPEAPSSRPPSSFIRQTRYKLKLDGLADFVLCLFVSLKMLNDF